VTTSKPASSSTSAGRATEVLELDEDAPVGAEADAVLGERGAPGRLDGRYPEAQAAMPARADARVGLR
jgi:hypothetical protein